MIFIKMIRWKLFAKSKVVPYSFTYGAKTRNAKTN